MMPAQSKMRLRHNVLLSMRAYVHGPNREAIKHVYYEKESALLVALFGCGDYFSLTLKHSHSADIDTIMQAIADGGLPVFLYYWYRRGDKQCHAS